MSWLLEFVDYRSAKAGSAATSTTEFTLNIDPQSISGIDYFKHEPRTATVSMFNDAWTATNIDIFLSGSGNNITGTDYFIYTFRITYNRNIEFIGYLRRDMVLYTEEDNTYSFRLFDSLKVVFDLAKANVEGSGEGNPTLAYNLSNRLTELLEDIITNQNQQFNISINNNYDLLNGYVIDKYLVYQKSNDEDIAIYENIDDWEWYTEDLGHPDFSQLEVNEFTDWVCAKSWCYVGLAPGTGTTGFYLMKYFQKVGYIQTGTTSYAYTLEEKIYIRWGGINYNFQGYPNFHRATGGAVISDYDEMVEIVNANELYYDVYINSNIPYQPSGGFPEANQLQYDIGDDHYTIKTPDGSVVYSGIYNLTSISIDNSFERTKESELNLYLMINNLALTVLKNGDFEIVNKNVGNDPEVEIDNLIQPSKSGLLKKIPDYNSIVSIVTPNGNLKESIAKIMKDYYTTLFETLTSELSFEVQNEYDLSINQNINIDGISYKIASISLDNERFIYTIKAWRI